MRTGACRYVDQFLANFPEGSIARIWVKGGKEGKLIDEPELGLDGTGLFKIISWGHNNVLVYLLNPDNPGESIRQMVIKYDEIVAMRRGLDV